MHKVESRNLWSLQTKSNYVLFTDHPYHHECKMIDVVSETLSRDWRKEPLCFCGSALLSNGELGLKRDDSSNWLERRILSTALEQCFAERTKSAVNVKHSIFLRRYLTKFRTARELIEQPITCIDFDDLFSSEMTSSFFQWQNQKRDCFSMMVFGPFKT
jgi:hypothetical protein